MIENKDFCLISSVKYLEDSDAGSVPVLLSDFHVPDSCRPVHGGGKDQLIGHKKPEEKLRLVRSKLFNKISVTTLMVLIVQICK